MIGAEQHFDLLERVAAAAFRVRLELGAWLDREAYRDALSAELERRGLRLEQGKKYPLMYQGELLEEFALDVVDDKVVVALYKEKYFDEDHARILRSQLRVSGLPVGLAFNFGEMFQIRPEVRPISWRPGVAEESREFQESAWSARADFKMRL